MNRRYKECKRRMKTDDTHNGSRAELELKDRQKKEKRKKKKEEQEDDGKKV